MSVPIEELDDFVHSIHQKFDGEPSRWQDISMPLQKYHFASRLFDRAKKDEIVGGRCRWKLKVRNNDNFQVVDLYHRDSSNRVNMLTAGDMRWSMNTTNYHYDLDEEGFRQGGRAIVNYMRLQEDSMMIDYFAGMEDLMFGSGPTSPTQKPNPPSSILWWLGASATEGFNGAEPSGFTDVGGIATGTYPEWMNRTFAYAEFTMDDAVEKTIRAMDKCLFKPPINLPNIVPQDRPDWELLTTYSRIEEANRLQRLQNENIGKDLYTGGTTIRGVPLVDVPAWTNSSSANARTDGPIIGMNWATMSYKFNAGRNMRKRKAFQHPEMSLVRIRSMDDSGQIVCYDRRANFRAYSTVTVTETD
jgi:hypothetical protein